MITKSEPQTSESQQPQVRRPPTWLEISEAGGRWAWVEKELARRGLIEDTAPSELSDAERKAFKARRDEERRTRRELLQETWRVYRSEHLVHVGRSIFWHDTNDPDRWDVDDLEGRREANGLPKLDSINELAEKLGLDVPTLRWLTFDREVDTTLHYHQWTVPKRSGGRRLISAPKKQLKAAQTWIAQHITEHLPVHGAAHGFVPGRSTATNAAPHCDSKVVVKLDLREFYPTISFRRVKGLFRKAGYREQIATLLALLCTAAPREVIARDGQDQFVAVGERSLPQGAPTSPSITNAICLRLDARLAGLARKSELRYTRYADDLTFSCPAAKELSVGKLLGAVRRIVLSEGFVLHPDKTRIRRSGRRQQITGLVVNGTMSPRPNRAFIRSLRAAIHNHERGRGLPGESLEQLRGRAAYVAMCDLDKGRAFLRQIDALRRGQEPAATIEEPSGGEPR